MASENAAMPNPLEHSLDSDSFHFPGGITFDVFEWTSKNLGFGLTKFMVLEIVAAILCVITFVYVSRNIKRNGYPKGVLANVFETIYLFLRENVAAPAIGEHDARKYMPFLASVFFFILYNNLLGMFPWMGSPTGALGCTGALALCSLFSIHGGGIANLGAKGYAEAFVPHVPGWLYVPMFFIELLGHLIKPTILAFRLFVNMLAGHTVLFVIMYFIVMSGSSIMWFLVAPASIVGVVLLSILELFVAFLQAYVFTFLSALFIGAAVHPHH